MKKKTWIVLGVIAAVVVIAGAVAVSNGKKAAFSQETAQIRDLVTYYSFDGNVTPADSQMVLSKSTQSVKEFFVEEGDMVKVGDPLFVLDNATLQDSLTAAEASLQIARINYESATGVSRDTQLSQAEAQLASSELNLTTAQRAYDRTAPLTEAGAASQAELEQAQTALESAQLAYNTAKTTRDNLIRTLDTAAATAAEQVKQAEAQRDSLQRQLDDTTVKAEVDGQVVELFVSENESVTLGTQILQIINYDTLEVQIKVDEYDLKAIQLGKEATIDILALNEQATGKVTKIDREATTVAGVSYFNTTVTLDPGAELRLGMSVEVRVQNDAVYGVVTVTAKAIQTDSDGSAFVYVQDQKGKPVATPVTLGITDGVYVEITEGLAAGDVVMVPTFSSSDPMVNMMNMNVVE